MRPARASCDRLATQIDWAANLARDLRSPAGHSEDKFCRVLDNKYSMIPNKDQDPGLHCVLDKLSSRDQLPRNNTVGIVLPTPTPKPDYAYGYHTDVFDATQTSVAHATCLDPCFDLYMLFLIIEVRSSVMDASLFQAANQCAG